MLTAEYSLISENSLKLQQQGTCEIAGAFVIFGFFLLQIKRKAKIN